MIRILEILKIVLPICGAVLTVFRHRTTERLAERIVEGFISGFAVWLAIVFLSVPFVPEASSILGENGGLPYLFAGFALLFITFLTILPHMRQVEAGPAGPPVGGRLLMLYVFGAMLYVPAVVRLVDPASCPRRCEKHSIWFVTAG